ncbi:hypothetical protein RRG08_044379 [Elysia crispata]|uniref:Glycosyltransferase family 92 protein n=1 Tax=Elysia crispata TaxID=231223 RepID=A0AAE0YNR7_9GAST|nr:hypothetical protein RRG08_044379 [Elysia crispata]
MFSQTQDNMRLKKIYLLFTFGTLFVCWVVFVQWPSKTDRSQLSFDYDLKVTEERSNRFSSRDNFEFRTVTTSVSLSGRETKIKYQTNKSATWPGFQVVHFPGSEFYVYSALLDEDRVVIIALKKREAQIKGLYCAYSLPGGGGVEQRWTSLVEAYVTNLSDHHDKLYTPAFIICALGKQSSESTAGSVGDNSTRRMVILVNGRDSADKPLAELQLETGSQRLGSGSSAVEGSDKGNNRDEVEFTVCSSIFHDNYNNAEQLVEMLELNRLLGAGRVVLYDNSVSDNVKDVLAMYAREWAEGRESLQVLLLPWKLPALFHSGVGRDSDSGVLYRPPVAVSVEIAIVASYIVRQ